MSKDLTGTGTNATLSQRVAEEIRAMLGRRRMSQAGLARALGVSPMWVNYRLMGTQPIDLDDLELIARALSVEVADLLPPMREGQVITTAGALRSPQPNPR